MAAQRHDADEPAGAPSPPPGSAGAPRALEVAARVASAVGGAAVVTGRWVAATARGAYHAVDPDVRRHLADLPLVATTMLGPRRTEIEPRPDDGRPPCLFVHGLGGHPQNFLPAKLWFRFRGRRRSYTLAYDDAAPLEDAAALLAVALEEIVRVNGLAADARVDLVAHSMGGIVARLALAAPEVAARVATVVTLGTPHHGTLAARFLATPRSLDLRPDSALVQRLAGQLPWAGPPAMPRLVAFWSRADVLMLPPETARVEGAESVEIPRISHAGWLVDAAVLDRVHRALG